MIRRLFYYEIDTPYHKVMVSAKMKDFYLHYKLIKMLSEIAERRDGKLTVKPLTLLLAIKVKFRNWRVK